ncbi:hypothetical protein CH53_2935 [Yersinia intermedia]|nr:hypothetical protein CH53_2935 [Yersinia intermedia]
MDIFHLEKHPHVELCDLLKLQGWNDSGASAKAAIADGQVKVDGNVETRKRCKILADQIVEFQGMKVQVKAKSPRQRRVLAGYCERLPWRDKGKKMRLLVSTRTAIFLDADS